MALKVAPAAGLAEEENQPSQTESAQDVTIALCELAELLFVARGLYWESGLEPVYLEGAFGRASKVEVPGKSK